MSHLQRTYWKPTPIDLPPLVRTPRGLVRCWTPKPTAAAPFLLERRRPNLRHYWALTPLEMQAARWIAAIVIVAACALIALSVHELCDWSAYKFRP